jgi:hypothetical protein
MACRKRLLPYYVIASYLVSCLVSMRWQLHLSVDDTVERFIGDFLKFFSSKPTSGRKKDSVIGITLHTIAPKRKARAFI